MNAAITPDVSTNYYHGDALGSARIMTSVNGYPVWQGTYLPFGDEFNPQITVNNYKFTGMERDAESDLDHTWSRQYSSTVDRWMTPDPLGGDLTNPQSLNRYAYAMNNPTTLVDPTGLASDCTANEDNTVTCAIGDTITVYGGEPPNIPTIGCWNLDGYGCSYNGPNYAYAGGTGTGSGGGGTGSGTPPPTKPAPTPPKSVNPCAPSGNAPPPNYFEAKGLTAYVLETSPGVPTVPGSGALTNVTGLALNGYNLFSFHRGGSLDAQAYGASPAYGNYVFGVYMGAMGYSLPFTLSAANLYGQFFSTYHPRSANPIDQVYTHIPAANVSSIAAGYNAEQSGTLCSAY